MDSLIRPPIGFAHRGARAHAPENTIEGFRLALEMGATGLESDVWLTEDGVAVLDHDGVVRKGLRKRQISSFALRLLTRNVSTQEEMYAEFVHDFEISL